MFGKKGFAAVLLEIKTNTWKDLGWSNQPEQTLFFYTLCCISNPSKGTGSTWNNQDYDSTVGICSTLERSAWTGFKPQSQTVRSRMLAETGTDGAGTKKGAGGQQKCHSSNRVLNQGHTWPPLLEGQGKAKMCWLSMQGQEAIPGQVLHSKVDCSPEGNVCITAKHMTATLPAHNSCLHSYLSSLQRVWSHLIKISAPCFVTTSQRNAGLEF